MMAEALIARAPSLPRNLTSYHQVEGYHTTPLLVWRTRILGDSLRRGRDFHKAGCKSAAKISEKNLVHYNSRDEAIQAGKKPCAECNP